MVQLSKERPKTRRDEPFLPKPKSYQVRDLLEVWENQVEARKRAIAARESITRTQHTDIAISATDLPSIEPKPPTLTYLIERIIRFVRALLRCPS